MRRKTRLTLVIALFSIVVVTAVFSVLRNRTGQKRGEPIGWGRGKLKAAERAYYQSRISRIIENWQETDEYVQRDKDGRIVEPHNIYLVIDTNKPAIWIEENGSIIKENYSDLPGNTKCKVYRCAPEGNTELTGLVRFKTRGYYTNRQYPEMLYLIAQTRSSGHISFDFNSSARGSGYGSAQFQLQPYRSRRKKKDDYYQSIVVTDAEYEQYQRSVAVSAAKTESEKKEQEIEKSLVGENLTSWVKAEKRLYYEIERRVMEEDFELRHLEVETGPDYSAGHAEVRANSDSTIRSFFGGNSYTETYLKIDYLGNDTWYVKSAPHPRRPRLRRQLDLEFLVRATGEVPGSEYEKWLEEGRKKQQVVARPAPKWQITLPNRVTVEFIGICENPSAGKQWWGPDGSGLEYSPYFNAKSYGRKRDDRKMYEIAWKISFPKDTQGSGTTGSLEGCMGSCYHQIHDKYGNDIHDIHAEGYVFEESRGKTTWKAGLKVGNEDYEWVTFKNISLVRGKNFGFEIELGK